MKRIKIIAALLVVLALLVTAFIPATGMAASAGSGIEPRPAASDDAGDEEPNPDEGNDQEEPQPDENFPNPPAVTVDPDRQSVTKSVDISRGNGSAETVGVLCSAPVSIKLEVTGGQDGYRYTWNVTGNEGQASHNPLPEGVSSTPGSTTSITLGRTELGIADNATYTCLVERPRNQDDPADTSQWVTVGTASFPVRTYGVSLEKTRPSGTESSINVNYNAEANAVMETLGVKHTEKNWEDTAITLGPTAIQDFYYYWHCKGLSETWGQDKTTMDEVPLHLNKDDLAAGKWAYTCESLGVGVDRANGKHDFTVHTMAQMLPISDYDHPEKFGLSQFTNKPEISTDDLNRTMSIRFEVSRSNEVVAIGVEWAHDIAPKSDQIKYMWQSGTDEPKESPVTGYPNVVHITVNTSRQDTWKCQPVLTGDEFADQYWQGGAVTFNVSVFLQRNKPEIEGIFQIKGETTVRPQNHAFSLQLGEDLCLEARVVGSGVEDVRGLVYWWSYVDETNTERPINPRGEVEMTTGPFRVTEGSKHLLLDNISSEYNGWTIKVVAHNSEQYESDETDLSSVRLNVSTSAASPSLTLHVDDIFNGVVQTTEGSSVTFSVTEETGINPKVLEYEWMIANVEDPKDSDFTAISGANEAEYTAENLKRRTGENVSRYYYRCRVTNTAGTFPVRMNSETVCVEVRAQRGAVRFIKPQSEQTYTGQNRIISGNALQFEVAAQLDDGNTTGISYQWEMAYGATERDVRYVAIPETIPLATTETYDTGLLDAGWYMFRCVAENSSNTQMHATSPMFIVEVEQNPNIPIVEYLTDRKVGVREGETARMKIRAHTVTGDPVSYQWRRTNGTTNEVIASGTRPTLTLARVESAQNDTQYICRVTNERSKDVYDTKPFTLNVWNADDMPVILTQPVNLRMQRDTVGAVDGKLEIVVQATDSSNFIFYWERWNESTEEWTQAEQEPEDFIGEESCSSVLHFTGVDSDAGKYRCAVENTDGSPAGATTNSNEVTVVLRDRHVPCITTQPPVKVFASIGKTASLRVIADIEPAQELSYTWMVTSDGGKTWRNATSAEGNGFNTNVFTTVPMQKNSVGRSQLYKCKVQGVEGGVAVETNVSTVIPKNPSPELEVNSDSPLRVTVNPSTGERFLTGQDITMTNELLTPQFIAEMFDLSGVRNGSVEITRNGELMEEGDPIGTGCVVTLLDSKGVPLDEVEIVVMGDVLGTGEASVSQLVAIAQVLKGTGKSLTGAYAFASDHNQNGKACDLSDLVEEAKMYRRVAGVDPFPEPEPEPEETPSPSAR